MTERRLSAQCPICAGTLDVCRLSCQCGTIIETAVPVPAFFRLPPDLQEFVLIFLRVRGNIKEVEKALGVSYPTVCKRLDQVNRILNNECNSNNMRMEILGRLERGELSAKQAAKLLRGEDDL